MDNLVELESKWKTPKTQEMNILQGGGPGLHGDIQPLPMAALLTSSAMSACEPLYWGQHLAVLTTELHMEEDCLPMYSGDIS